MVTSFVLCRGKVKGTAIIEVQPHRNSPIPKLRTTAIAPLKTRANHVRVLAAAPLPANAALLLTAQTTKENRQ
jgi:hypothetical protein